MLWEQMSGLKWGRSSLRIKKKAMPRPYMIYKTVARSARV